METTRDYTKFKSHPANRAIVLSLITKLKPSMEKYGWLEGRPLLVNKNNETLDGQHRLEVAKLLSLAVPYVVLDGDAEAQIIALNANQSPWKIIDFVQSYATQKKDCYRKLLKFEEKYNLGISNSIDIFLLENVKCNQVIRAGQEFEINPNADAIADYVMNCDVPFNTTSKFLRAVAYIFKKLNPNQRQVILSNVMKVPQCHSVGEYLIIFENLLNKGKIGKNRISLQPTKRIG